MANTWFKFKQFTVVQQRSAMKVSTDACIQGAWTARFINKQNGSDMDILDIGTGTGLLSLMLAQETSPKSIDAIDTDADAAEEAGFNFATSPWQHRLNISHTALQAYTTGKQYDYIICNPPFFHNQLHANGAARNTARHDISLSKKELARYASALLKKTGFISVMFPASEWDEWLTVALGEGLAVNTCLYIFPHAGKPANRIVGIFSSTPPLAQQLQELIIRDEPDQYSIAFKALMQPYYLNL